MHLRACRQGRGCVLPAHGRLAELTDPMDRGGGAVDEGEEGCVVGWQGCRGGYL